MIYPDNFEQKIGFAAVRRSIGELCISALGRTFCSEMKFCTDFSIVYTALHRVNEVKSMIESSEAIPVSNVCDVTRQLHQISVDGSFLPAADLSEVRKALIAMDEIHSYFSETVDDNPRHPYMRDVVRDMVTFRPSIAAIDSVIDRHGNVRDDASELLGQIRSQLNSMAGRVNNVMRRVMANAVRDGILEADASPAMRDGRLVLPVAPMNKRRLNGIIHDESASGKTIYIEPAEVVEINNRIRELELEEHREIVRILSATTARLRPYVPDMLASSSILGEVDFILAKARYAIDVDASLPTLSKEPELELYHACHPGLLTTLRRQGKDIVPLDINLSYKNRILVISGPNAGGKSVTLKTVGIVQYMVQCGLLPPVYENSHIGIFDDIFVDIGDDQSIENDLSTYSSHLRNMRQLVRHGRKTTLVLIDEFGGGTEPQIGGALAQAILHRLNDLNVWGVITTHYQNLKHFADDTDGLINGSMLYDRQFMRPLFKLSIGHPGSSFALEIARKTGLPAEIISEAEEIVGSDYINSDKFLMDIARDRRYWENKRLAIRQKEKKLEQTLERYGNDAEELREKRREIIAHAKEEARKILENSNAAVERAIHEIRRSQANREQTLLARQQLAKTRQELSDSEAEEHIALKKAPKRKKNTKRSTNPSQTERPIVVGDTVKLDGEGLAGKVIELNGDNATVVFGMLKTTVKIARLRHTLSKVDSGASKSASFVSVSTSNDLRTRQLNFKQDLDIRGMRVDEGIQAVTYFIDDAIQFSTSRVRILHGTGTGALRQYIRQYLSTVNGIKSFHDEDVRFGGAGITVVDLY